MSANSTVVAAGVSATLQLLRVVVDLVTVASQTAKRKEAKIENAKSPPSDDADGKELERSGGGGRRFSVRNFDGRLSAVSVRGFGVSFQPGCTARAFMSAKCHGPGFFLAAESDERLKSLHLRNF